MKKFCSGIGCTKSNEVIDDSDIWLCDECKDRESDKYIASLETQNKELKRANSRLSVANKHLSKQNEELKNESDKTGTLIDQLRHENKAISELLKTETHNFMLFRKEHYENGITQRPTIRQQVAAAAMQGILSNPTTMSKIHKSSYPVSGIWRDAITIADGLIKAEKETADKALEVVGET